MDRPAPNPVSRLRILQLAMGVQFAVGGAVMPFVSLLLRDRGLDYGQIGTIFFASSSTLLIFPFVWGMLADRYLPLNRLFTLLNVLAMLALVGFAFQQSFWGLLISFTAFYATFNPTLTLINALSFHHLPDARAQFAVLRSWGSVGWILPSLPVYLWLALAQPNPDAPGADLDFVVYFGLGLTVAMASLTLFLPHTPPGAKRRDSDPERVAYWPAVRLLITDANYVTLLCSFFLIAGSFSLFFYYSPPFFEDLGVDRAWIGPIQCIGVGFEILLLRWQPVFVRGWRYQTSILFGCLCLMVRHLLFAFSSNLWLLCASYLLTGMVIVFYHVGLSILVNAMARTEIRATAQTLLVFFGSGMGPMFSNWLAGRLATYYGGSLRPVFLFAAGLAGAAAILIAVRGRKLEPTMISASAPPRPGD